MADQVRSRGPMRSSNDRITRWRSYAPNNETGYALGSRTACVCLTIWSYAYYQLPVDAFYWMDEGRAASVQFRQFAGRRVQQRCCLSCQGGAR